MTPAKLEVAREMYASRQHTIAAIAAVVGASRATLYRTLATDPVASSSPPEPAAPATPAEAPAITVAPATAAAPAEAPPAARVSEGRAPAMALAEHPQRRRGSA